MPHGRDHQEREQKIRIRRASQTSEPSSFEAQLLGAGRTRGTPKQRLFGANSAPGARRATPAEDFDEPEPIGGGAEVAPTRRAEERERERHRAERKIGRMAAGIGENLRDRREPGVTRQALDQAARAADQKVTSGANATPRRSPVKRAAPARKAPAAKRSPSAKKRPAPAKRSAKKTARAR